MFLKVYTVFLRFSLNLFGFEWFCAFYSVSGSLCFVLLFNPVVMFVRFVDITDRARDDGLRAGSRSQAAKVWDIYKSATGQWHTT